MSRLETRTADPENSIWRELPENTFRQHLVDLEKRTNAVPVDSQIFPLEPRSAPDDHTLPLQVEQQFADDLAFLAAIEEGAQSVAAVCLEEHIEPAGLTVRFASLDLALGEDVKDALQRIADGLLVSPGNCLKAEDGLKEIEPLFEQIVSLHFRRLLARLRSNKWEKPKYLSRQHKKPLWQDFTNIIHRVQFLYTKREAASRRSVESQLQNLAVHYEAFETPETGSHEEFSALQRLIGASYEFCVTKEVIAFAQRLEASVTTTPTPKVASAIKCLRQIEKIGAYWRIAKSLEETSRTYPELFRERVHLAFLTPYKSVPTDIGYETWATTCHVHAEVQLAVHYDILSQTTSTKAGFRRPRVIGTSKWLCYLCYLFLRSHGLFFPANTHGRLYDQWTVPDLAEYDEELRTRYRLIVQGIDMEVVRERNLLISASPPDAETGLVRWRAEPMTSRQNLLCLDHEVQPDMDKEEDKLT